MQALWSLYVVTCKFYDISTWHTALAKFFSWLRISIPFNPFHAAGLFLYPKDFLMFSGGVERDKCDALRDLVQFVQFKKHEKHPWWRDTYSKVPGFSLQLQLKVTRLHGCFSRFLNFINGRKTREGSEMIWNELIMMLNHTPAYCFL